MSLTSLVLGIAVAVIVTSVASQVVGEVRYRRRCVQAREAGLESIRRLEARERTQPSRIEINLSDWGDHALDPNSRWRWVVWNAHPEPEDVRGMLVPYLLGNSPTRERAIATATSMAEDRGFPVEDAVIVDRRPGFNDSSRR